MSRRVWRELGLRARNAPLDQDRVEPIGLDPARLGDHAHRLLYERREVEAVDLGGSHHLSTIISSVIAIAWSRSGNSRSTSAAVALGLLFLDVDPHLLGLAVLPPAPPKPLEHRATVHAGPT